MSPDPLRAMAGGKYRNPQDILPDPPGKFNREIIYRSTSQSSKYPESYRVILPR
jgi:hypothetical protein